MDATTLLGTLLAELLEGTAHLVVRAVGWPSPGQMVAGSLTAGARVLLEAAVLAWVAGVFAVLVAVSGRGAAGASAPRSSRPAPPLPPRRVRAAAPEPAPVLVVTAEAAPVVAEPVEVVPLVAAAAPVVVAAPAPRVAPATLRARGSARTAATPPRCRRCTQPRCWPSTGERHPARAAGTGAPRACRTSPTAGTTHRCGPAPWRGRERCAVPARARPARPGPGSDRTPALPR